MQYDDLISGIYRFVDDGTDICARFLGVESKRIQRNVVISPGWKPERMPALGNPELIASGALYGSLNVWNINTGDEEITYIQTGCGAPILMDALLSLGVSDCENIIFVSSVGAVDANISIGDIVIPEYSITGDGASRYIASNALDKDVFGEKMCPDASLLNQLKLETEKICKETNTKWHIGRTFCTDTIFAEFAHVDTIISTGCNSIDMETAVAFRSAKLMNKPIVALLNVTDNTVARKSLINETTKNEDEYRLFVRREVFPRIINGFIKSI
ncbi:MAG: phosphorylase [Clostridia bacterium]|nr:phosphorylase [Clostridia bacterium]